jgi:hypothetical protein
MYIPQQTQFIKRDNMASLAIVMAWLFGVIMPILISTHGNYIMFRGGWDGFTFPRYAGNIAFAAIGYQVVCSAAQFGFKAAGKTYGGHGWWIAYIVSLLVSVVPSFIAYYQGFAPGLIAPLTAFTGNATLPLVAAIIFVASLILDWLPEWVAVEG